MRRFPSVLSTLFWLCLGTYALHESDVGVVDWHKELIGVPLSGPVSAAPSFHRVGNETLILSATSSNVLAALEPENGSIRWRYLFNPEDRIAGYYKNESVIATLSGPGGATLRTFRALNGQLLLEKRLHLPASGALSEPFHFGKDVIFSPNSDQLYVLTNGCSISAINSITGELTWHWEAPDQGSLIIHNKLVLTNDALYAVGFAKSLVSYTLHITSINPQTGKIIEASNIGTASIVDPLTELTVVTSLDLPKPIALWLEQGSLRHLALTPTLREKPKPLKGSGYTRIEDVGMAHQGQVVLVRRNGLGVVLKVEGDKFTSKATWEFEELPFSKENSDSLYAAGLDGSGRPYFSRIFWAHTIQRGAVDVFAEHIGLGGASSFVFPFETKKHGVITSAAISPDNPSEWILRSDVLLVTSTGSVQMWRQDSLLWTREEALSGISVAELVEIPEKVASETSSTENSEGYLSRLTRHIADTQNLPLYLTNFAKRFATGSYASVVTSTAGDNTTEGLYRDAFGFRQVIVAATLFGKVYGIDSSNGQILWSRVFGLGWADEVGGVVIPLKIYTIKTVSDGTEPEVVIVGQRRAENSLVDTVVFHINAMTGLNVNEQTTTEDLLYGQDVIAGPVVESYFLTGETKMAILLDEYLQVYLYPDTPETRKTFEELAPTMSFPLRSNTDGIRRVLGHQISPSKDNFKPLAIPTWSLSLAPGEDVQSIVPPASRGPIASLGKVVGNRTTLYKYLNPRLFTVLTATPSKSQCGIYVVDSMKGAIVYHAEVKANLRGCDIKITLVDNWLVYHYYEGEVPDGSVGGSKGYRIVSVEFYEGQGVDDKTKSSELSAFSDDAFNFHAHEQTYIVPYAITTLAATTTRFGISNRDIIVATKDNKIQYISKMFLNPRRPNRKPNAEEAEEFLIEYDSLLPNDPRRVLSHNYKVAHVQKIITSPALLESTSLIFAYGLDLFMTRLAPSNTFDVLSENFNKAQLVLTVGGLAIAILITRPMVNKKRLREKWYQ
ncbi:hypothetical protein CPB83DRAFT_813238 [Crepidotus variabilis]|uniref:ER membrane protein complex subunit 1 n=1 Tax=Crepidotus variabilis TaxID=179855 RepID=A0A9P6EH15_9AGAR|nr:hypothetical protein CPB83DRAFT_813238 [Crepidotus variabilis]